MLKRPIHEDIHSKQMMNRVNTPRMPFHWSLNPYRGCTHGCSFCYARTTHTFMGLCADDTFRNHIFIKSDASTILEQQLQRMLRRHGGSMARLAQEIGHLAIGTATDPYQPVEARRHVTRDCLEVLQRYKIPVSITTRSPLILRDLPLLRTMHLVSVNISLNSMNKTVWRNLEPSTPSPEKRLQTVQQLADEGLPVGVFVAPIIPYLTDSLRDLEELIAASSGHGANFIMPSVLRLSPDVKTWFLQTLERHYPQLVPRYQRLYKTPYAPSTYTKPLMTQVHRFMDSYGLGKIPVSHPSPVEEVELTGEQMILPI